jgi:hypothetical protein
MRTVLVVACALAVAGAGGTTGRSAKSPPQLKLTGTVPIAIRGLAFRPAERVNVVLRMSTSATWTQKTTASRVGMFNVVFNAAKAGHCTGFTVQATGSKGSKAELHRVRLPACMPE